MTVSWFDGATLEVSFTQNKGALDTVVDGDFTDVSAYVRDVVRINRGRGAETDAFTTGSLQLVLDNRDRRFDPEYSSGPYFGKLLPMRHVRVRLTYSGSTSYLFHGFVRGWQQGWDVGGSDAICTVTADDAFKVMANTALPASLYAAEVLADAPTGWYRLDEAAEEDICRDSSGNGRHGIYDTAVTSTSVSPLGDWIDGAARESSPLLGKRLAYSGDIAPIAGTAWSFEFWVTVPVMGVGLGLIRLWIQSGTSAGLDIGINGSLSGPTLTVTGSTADGGAASLNVDYTPYDNGSPHHIVITYSGTTMACYVDGAAVTPTSSSASATASGNWGTSAGIHFGPLSTVRPETFTTSLDEVAHYSTALSSARVLAHYVAGRTGAAGETVDDRITRVLAAAGMSSFPTSLDASTQTVRGCDFGGGSTTLLAHLQMLERTENGRLFIAADGTLTFHSRHHDAGSAVTTAFSDASGTTLPYRELGHEYDDARVINDARVTRTGGVTQRVSDSTSKDTYGARSVSVEIAAESDNDAFDRATAIVYKYKDAKARFTSVAVSPRSAPSTLFPVVRQREVGDRISVRRLPVGTGSAFTKELTIEGVQHAFDVDGNWVTSYLTASGELSSVWFILDDATYGLLDTGRLGF